MAFHLCLGASVRPAAALSAGHHGCGVDSRLGLPCGCRGWHTGPTYEASDRQDDYRWGAGPRPGAAAPGSLRRVDERGPQAQGRSGAASRGVLSRPAAVRRGWHSVFDQQHPASQKAKAQGAQSARAGGVPESGRRGHGGIGAAQSIGRKLGRPRGIGDGAGPSSLVGPAGEELADQRPILRSARIAGGLACVRGPASFSAGEKESQAALAGSVFGRQRFSGNLLRAEDALDARNPGPGAARVWGSLHPGALVDHFAGLAPASGGRIAAVVCPALGAGVVLQGIESGHAFDPLFAESHPVDGYAGDHGVDPGLCRPGGLPNGGGGGGRSGRAADQFYEDAASRSGVVAVPGGIGGFIEPGSGAFSGAPFLATHCRHGDPQASPAILPASVAPAGQQLAATAQKHLPQRKHPIRRRRHLCLNSYTALFLGPDLLGGCYKGQLQPYNLKEIPGLITPVISK